MRARPLVAALAACAAAVAAAPATASAAIAFAPCAPAGYECGALSVALDRSGSRGGTVTLQAKRVPAASNPTATAVVALAGGPGQAALPLATDFAEVMAPALAARDLLVFDQRGTGRSGRLRCAALESRSSSRADAVRRCARQLGPRRAFYRTADSVADL
jgi:pimeloyl-ACP methyl ester carboxylesterase